MAMKSLTGKRCKTMKKEIFQMVLNIIKDVTHKGAPFTLDRKTYFNGGDANEIQVKAVHGLPAVKDSNGAYDVTDDIPQFSASVKSNAATLVNRVLGNDFDSTIKAYFETVHSKNVWYAVSDYEKHTITVYKMNHIEFREYLKRFSKFDETRKVIRLNKDAASKNLRWLDAKSRV